MSSGIPPLHHLDRDLRRAAARLREARRALDLGEPSSEQNPLDRERPISCRDTWLELAPPAPVERPGEALGLRPGEAPPPIVIVDPLRAAVRTWVETLTLERVLWADRVRLAAARRARTAQIDQVDLGRIVLSPRELIERLLADPDRGPRLVFAAALARGSSAVADAARIYAERRAEAARRFPTDLDALEIPCEPQQALPTAAIALLRRTEPFLRPAGESWHDTLTESLGRGAAEGWPARLTPRWIEEMFRPTRLTHGLRLSLGELPRALGATSFARALATFGAALADEDGPGSAPFALAHPPFDLRRARRAALFGSLVADPVFTRIALGLGRERAHAQARAVARALLRGLRLDAARVLLRGALLLPERARSPLFQERTAEALLGTPIPPSLAGVLPSFDPEDATRLLGVLLAASDRRRLIETFDEDWFRSPHAAEMIREEDANLGPLTRTTEAEVLRGLDELCRVLADLG